MVELPQDVIELIVNRIPLDFSSNEAQCALLACSAVSHSFRYPARKALFSTVTLEAHSSKLSTTTNPTDHLVSLCELFCKNVELKALVRHLHIQVDDRRLLLEDDNNLTAIINLLMEVPSLESLWITGYRRRPFEWGNIGPLSWVSILRLLDRANIRSLRLSNILGVPPFLVQRSQSLRHVELIHTTFDPLFPEPPLADGLISQPAQIAPTALRSLTVHGYIFHFDATFFNPSSAAVVWSGFNTLSSFKGLIRDRMGVNALSHVVQTVSGSLSQLTL